MIVERINIFSDKEERLFVFHTEKDMIEIKIFKGFIKTRKTQGVDNPVILDAVKDKTKKKGGFFGFGKTRSDESLSKSLEQKEDEEYFESL
jgi:hypothetical protein